MTVQDFPFAEYAPLFDQHIADSIRGLDDLHAECIAISRYFVQSETTVVDIGCSTGKLLAAIRGENEPSRPDVSYLGIDIVPEYCEQWSARSRQNIRFEVRDARSFDGFQNLSLACSLFTMQFIHERHRLDLLRRLHDGLNEGGALIIAEKVHANTPKFQDMLTSIYYDFKSESFGADEIFGKERSLRGQMNLWSDELWEKQLRETGFEVQRFWQNYLFVGWIARKGVVAAKGERRPRGFRPRLVGAG